MRWRIYIIIFLIESLLDLIDKPWTVKFKHVWNLFDQIYNVGKW